MTSLEFDHWSNSVNVTTKNGEWQVVASANSFELFGFDVLIDTNLKCWLIEVPPTPSLPGT